MTNKNENAQHRDSTLAALLKEKPRRGRPRHAVTRQSVYVALTKQQKQSISEMAKRTPAGINRADIPDMAIILLSSRLSRLRLAVSGRDRELPEGITDLRGLYYLWDLPTENDDGEAKWTSIRLSPTWVVEFGRLQGTFNALFGANRSDVFALALSLLDYQTQQQPNLYKTLDEFEKSLE